MDVEQHFRLAKEYFQNAQFEQAKEILNELIDFDCTFSYAFNLQGAIAVQLQQFEQAEQLFKQAIFLNAQAFDFYLNLGQLYLAQHKNVAAIPLLEKSLTINPNQQDVRQQVIQYLLSQQHHAGAYRHIQAYLKLQPNTPQLKPISIQLAALQGLFHEALDTLKALELDSQTIQLWEYVAVQALQQGELDFACQGFEQVLAAHPKISKTHNSLGVIYGQLDQPQKSLRFFNQAIELDPDYSEAYLNRAQLIYSMDEASEQVVTDIEKALILNGDLAEKILEFERLLPAYGELRFKLLKLIECYGTNALDKTLILLATGYELLNNYEKAQEYYQKYLKRHPHHFWYEIKLATLHPAIYQGKEDIEFHRQRISRELGKLSQKYTNNRELILQCPLPEKFTSYLFYLAYHGLNDKDLYSQCGQLWDLIFSQIFSKHTFKPLSNSPIRIGFISTYFRHHSVMDCFWTIIKALAQDPQFQVICIALSGMGEEDELTREIKNTVHELTYIPFGLKAREKILEKQLDILVYTDIGMEPTTYLTSQWRLAPNQVVFMGHPVTTGSCYMDYAISTEFLEGPEAQTHYSETLTLLKTLGVNYSKPLLPEVIKSREELGWPEDKNIYFCPMTLFKVHPDFDLIIRDILLKDSQGLVIFVHDDQRVFSHHLLKRFKRNIPEVIDQIKFMDWIPFDNFLQLLYRADVVLDTIHFGGGNTIYQTLAVGTPIVSWPSPYLRGRGAYGLCQFIGVTECLAENYQDYAEKAVKIAVDKLYQEKLRQLILNNHSVLFNNNDGPEELIQFFKTISEGR